jgi:hypothetical protein
MTGRDVAILSCRLMAIYALLHAFAMISTAAQFIRPWLFYSSSGSQISPLLAAAALLHVLASLAMADILWVRAERIANRLLPYQSPQAATTSLDLEGFQAVAISLIGLFVLVTAIPGIFQSLGYYLAYRDMLPSSSLRPLVPGWAVTATGTVLYGIVGLLLVTQPGRAKRMLARLRRDDGKTASDPQS